MSGLVTFRLGEREYATDLRAVREVVRLHGLADLPGMVSPLAGVLDVRGAALPVLDLRPPSRGAAADRRGDVLVLEPADAGGSPVGVAVDEVRAVTDAADLPRAAAGAVSDVLPSYVVDVLRGPSGVVFLVDLAAMLAGVRAAA